MLNIMLTIALFTSNFYFNYWTKNLGIAKPQYLQSSFPH